ncbi:B12-binding domain-containing radical SAM protein [Planctomycetota bacterium]
MKPKQRIAFIIPGHMKKMRFLSSDLGLRLLERFSHFVFYNTGTLQLASIMKHRGHEVSLVFDDGRNVSPRQIDAEVICLSLTTAAAPRGYEIAQMFADRTVIIGGPHASALPAEAAEHADHVVIGEGEHVLPRIIDGEIDGRIVNAGLLQDLDGIPYLDFSLLPFKPKNFPIVTSRGCPFDCCFCAVTKMFGRKVRMRSPESIVNEIKHYVRKHGEVERLDLISPNFTIQRKHCIQVLERLLAEGIRPALEIRTSTHIHNDTVIPELLSQFPVVSMLVGAESFEQEALDYYKKKRSEDDFRVFMKRMKDYGFNVVTSFIWGNKFDTPDSMWRLLDNIYELDPSHFQVGLLTPFPGTALYEEVRDDIFVDDWSYYDVMHVTHFHPKMDPLTMQTTWLKAQKQMWSLRSLAKRYRTLFSPPINKLFYWVLSRFAEAEFADFLEFLKGVEKPRQAAQHAPAMRASGERQHGEYSRLPAPHPATSELAASQLAPLRRRGG